MTKKQENSIINMQEYVTKIPRRLNVMYFNDAFTQKDWDNHILDIERYSNKLSDALLCLIPNDNTSSTPNL